MNLQYINDDKGNATGIFIPIDEWQDLKRKYKGLQEEELRGHEMPEWHKKVLDKRLENYKNTPQDSVDFDVAMTKLKQKYA